MKFFFVVVIKIRKPNKQPFQEKKTIGVQV